MNDKKRQRHIAYEVLVILGQLALLTYITRLWPILLLVILGIFIAALRLLFLSSQKVEPVKPLLTLPPPKQPPTEKDLQSAASSGKGNDPTDADHWKGPAVHQTEPADRRYPIEYRR